MTGWLWIMSLALATGPAASDTPTPDEPKERPDVHWTITFDPITTVLGFTHLQIERSLGKWVSVYVGPSLHLHNEPWSEQQPYRGIGAELGVRIFPLGTAPKGLWVMTRGVLASLHTTDGTKQRALGGYGSVLVGYTGLIGRHFVLSGGLGVQRLKYTVGGYGLDSWAPAAHTNVGVAF
jgi:hypothetical protein